MRITKLNLGCGRTVLPGFINLDNSLSVLLNGNPFLRWVAHSSGLVSKNHLNWPQNIRWHEITKGLPYKNNTVDKIYSSHFLEHVERDKAIKILHECFRVLKPGGIFRLVVPDLVYHAKLYLKKTEEMSDEYTREHHDWLLFNISGAYLFKNRYGANHRYMYDWPTLKILLSETGFSKVIRQTYQQGYDQELFLLDNRPEDSLHIDAIK